jgi:glycosyltransferase involved in cell wall biosynthesis
MEHLGVTVREFSRKRLIGARYDVWHLHWPERFLNNRRTLKALTATAGLLLTMDWARLRGTRLVWTVHNLHGHERAHERLERYFWPRFVSRIDAFISLSDIGRDQALGAFPGLARKRSYVIPHGSYRDAYPDQISRADARATLGIEPGVGVFVSIGQLRRYKNLPHLVATFRRLTGDYRLIIAGMGRDAELLGNLRAAAAGDPRILIRAEFVPDGELQVYLRAADVMVLPYTDILNSGAAHLALSFDLPALVPHIGALPALQHRAGPSWVRTYRGDLTSPELLAALAWARDPSRPSHLALDASDWATVGRQTVAAFEEICGVPR